MPSDEAWVARLAADEQLLGERLSEEQKGVLAQVRKMFGTDDPADILGLGFLVVYGSYARGDMHDESDLDIYLEAANLREPFNRGDAGGRYQVYGLPPGALNSELRRGEEFGRRVVGDALVVYDRGSFRTILETVERGECPSDSGRSARGK